MYSSYTIAIFVDSQINKTESPVEVNDRFAVDIYIYIYIYIYFSLMG